MAQGGINAPLGNRDEDTVELHIENTLKSAHGEADEEAVRFMCSKAVDAIDYLESIGVCFSRDKNNKIAQRRLGGASAHRACYAQDYTGLKILHTLYDECNKHNIEILSDRFAYELIQNEQNRVCGARVFNLKNGEVENYFASAVVIATGGYARIYAKHSTNSTSTTGDGVALALRAGADLLGMEFVQFHPTALKTSSILISESARGEGGYILNSKMQRFTDELKPRDEVSRAIYFEMQKKEDIFLDIRHIGEEFINEGLPQERKLAKLYENVDPVKDLIPIKPVAHYSMGGIKVDNRSQTTLSGLFACGECANHRVHGANRLGGNSLLEIVVFGAEAGRNASEFAKQNRSEFNSLKSVKIDINTFFEKESKDIKINFYKKRDYLGDLLYENVGIAREKNRMLYAINEIKKMKNELSYMGITDKNKIYNTNLTEFLEFVNMLDIAHKVVESALQRDISCGAHFIIPSAKDYNED